MGLRPAEFWETTPADFERMRAGYYRRLATKDLFAWTHTREVLATLYNIYRPEGAKALTGPELMPLSLDPKPKKGKAKPVKKVNFLSLSPQEQADFFKRIRPLSPQEAATE